MSAWALLSWATKASTVVMEGRETGCFIRYGRSADCCEELMEQSGWCQGRVHVGKDKSDAPRQGGPGTAATGQSWWQVLESACFQVPGEHYIVFSVLMLLRKCWFMVTGMDILQRMKLCGLKWVECDCGTPPGAWSEITRKPVLLWGEAGYQSSSVRTE